MDEKNFAILFLRLHFDYRVCLRNFRQRGTGRLFGKHPFLPFRTLFVAWLAVRKSQPGVRKEFSASPLRFTTLSYKCTFILLQVSQSLSQQWYSNKLSICKQKKRYNVFSRISYIARQRLSQVLCVLCCSLPMSESSLFVHKWGSSIPLHAYPRICTE